MNQRLFISFLWLFSIAFSACLASSFRVPGEDATNCQSCGANNATDPYIMYLLKVPLGSADGYESLGELVLKSSDFGEDGFVPTLFDLSTSVVDTNAVKVIYGFDNEILQVSTPTRLIDIDTNIVGGFNVRVMRQAAQGNFSTNNWRYGFNNSLSYLIRLLSIDDLGVSTNGRTIRIRESGASGSTNEWLFYNVFTNKQWSMMPPGTNATFKLISEGGLETGNWTNRATWLGATGVALDQRFEVRTNFPWGQAKTMECLGGGSAARIQRFTYYDTTNTAGFPATSGRPALKDVVDSDGSWRCVTQYDPVGRKLNELSGLNTALTLDAALCRRTSMAYTPVDTSDDGTVTPDVPRTETYYCLNNVVGKLFRIISPAERRTLRGVRSNSILSDSDNLISYTKYFTSGAWVGRPYLSRSEDGTITTYEYLTLSNGLQETTTTGQADGSGNAVADGTRTIRVTGLRGELISATSKVIVSSSAFATVSQVVYSQFDELNRAGRADYLDGTYELWSYNCCSMDSSMDRDGVPTTYSYDGLGRQVAATRLGITITNLLDSVGRVVEVRRIGTDLSSIRLTSTVYDDSGMVVRETNAFGGVTFTYRGTDSSGLQVVTNVAPDGGTQIAVSQMDGSTDRVVGTAVSPYRIVCGIENTTDAENGTRTLCFKQTIRLDGDGYDTGEWTTEYTDALGRVVKILFSDGNYSLSYYNLLGQLSKTIDPDKVVTLYQYNGKGEQEYVAVDVNQDGAINFSGTDRIRQVTRDYTQLSSPWVGVVQRTRSYEYGANGAASTVLVSENWTSVDGLKTWSLPLGSTALMSRTETVINQATASRTVTSIAADGSYSVATFQNGRAVDVTRRYPNGSQLSKVTYGYDPHGRQSQITDARAGTTILAFNSADATTNVTTPLPGTGQSVQIRQSLYDSLGRVRVSIEPDGTSLTNEFTLTGALKKTYGTRAYPVEYTSDVQNRMKTMKTWRNFAANSGSAITTWKYDGYRGFMTNKTYADPLTGVPGSVGPGYTYTAGGRLKTRTWARSNSTSARIVTTYKYGFDDGTTGNHFPELTEVSYNDSVTPSIINGYDRRGRQTTVARNGMTTTRSLNDAGLLLSESYTGSGTTLNGLSVGATYDSYLRRQTFATKISSTAIGSSTYSYDSASRLDTVTDGTYSATYAYLPNSSLVDTVTFKQSTTAKMTTKRQYDYLNRLQSIANTPTGGGQLPASYAYLYNDANQRTRMTLGDGSYWVYEYDTLGQVKAGKHYWSDNSPIPGQLFEYGFDDIGNRNSTKSGGDASGQNLRSATYTANALNQYTQRTVPGSFDILGLATAANSVMVNGSPVDYRRGEYFQESVTAINNAASLWQSVTVIAGTATNTGNQYVAQTPESPTFDLDGNTTQDGRWTYTWDGENRLIALVSLTNAPAGAKRKIEFEYDWMGRRIGKKVYIYSGGAYPGSPNTTLKFLYDGWNLMAELDGANATVRTYQWGSDLSGSLQGAGGVGGLLTVKSTSGIAQFQGYDGNGNVMLTVDGAAGTRSAEFEYGPFGETLRASGTSSAACLNRFSTKYQDGDSSFYYYGYRYYDPSTGRWPNRDPESESAGLNLHNFVENNSINSIDPFGLSPIASNIDRISNALHDSVDKLNGSPISKALNLPYVVGLLSAEIYNFPVVFYPVIKDADAQFSGGRLEFTDEIGSDPVAKADTILHELVHARNARLRFPFVSRFGWGSREDEGMAYGLQLFLTTVVPRMDAGYGKITESGCNKVKISQAWKSLWSGDQASKPITDTASWLKGYYFAGNFAFIGDETDLSRMRQYLGINFGCEKIASLINKTLSENNCSFKVTCKKNDDNCFLIGSGAQITGEWAK